MAYFFIILVSDFYWRRYVIVSNSVNIALYYACYDTPNVDLNLAETDGLPFSLNFVINIVLRSQSLAGRKVEEIR